MRKLQTCVAAAGIALVSGCEPTPAVVDKASENLISISYEAYGMTPTLTAEALDIAIEHCKKRGLFANYSGAAVPNAFSTKEVHTFLCERVKRDDSKVIIAQNEQYLASNAVVVNTIRAPTYTTCRTFGIQTRCTSY